MRSYTLFVSLLVHAALLTAAFIAQATIIDALPIPRLSTSVVIVRPAPAPVVPVTPRRSVANVDSAPAIVNPLDVPTRVEPEVPDAPIEPPLPGGALLGTGNAAAAAFVEPPPLPPAPVAPRAIPRVGGVIRPPEKIVHVAPVYPPLARTAGIEGIVILDALIGEDGNVRDVKVLRSVRLLDQAAIDAVKQWRFTPSSLNGDPVPVLMTVTVRFALN